MSGIAFSLSDIMTSLDVTVTGTSTAGIEDLFPKVETPDIDAPIVEYRDGKLIGDALKDAFEKPVLVKLRGEFGEMLTYIHITAKGGAE